MENVRYNISPCSPDEVQGFISKIDSNVYVPNGIVKANDRSHYDRYSFLCDENRVAVVYDTSANIVSITGRGDHAKSLLDLFAPSLKLIKRSTVPAQNGAQQSKAGAEVQTQSVETPDDACGNAMRAKVFVSPDSLRRRSSIVSTPTVFATSKGAEISTDVIYPPQIAHKKPQPPQQREYSDNSNATAGYMSAINKRQSYSSDRLIGYEHEKQSAFGTDGDINRREDIGLTVSANAAKKTDGTPRRTVISFGGDEDDFAHKSDIRINTRAYAGQSGKPQNADAPIVADNPTEKRRRGRPPKIDKAQNNIVDSSELRSEKSGAAKYQNGYPVKNFPTEALSRLLKRLKSDGKQVVSDGTEFGGTPQEVKSYVVSDANGCRVILRYATNKKTLQLQGKSSELFGEIQSQVSRDSDYSSALEGYVEIGGAGKGRVSEVQALLKRRLPTAYEYLSEQSRIDFSYGIHDFGQTALRLSDYSGLLVPAFRGLERFIFDLQLAEGIKVKMIGQAYDKDNSGRYILKHGYTRRIGSVIYAEVMVSLYVEYFSQRNFFAHSDNTGGNISRSIPDRSTAKNIFDHLLDVVEYNAKKLKEIGFSMDRKQP